MSSSLVFATDWPVREKEFSGKIEPILKSVCLDCHSGAEADGGLALDHFKTAKSMTKERSTFEKVISRLQVGDMPPQDGTPLEPQQRKALIAWMDGLIHDVDCGKEPNPGAVTLRRLTKYEYRNTIRDIFGVDYEKSQEFPGDDVGYGFDNIGDVLNLPPLLMEKYIDAAEEISNMAIALPEPGPSINMQLPLDRINLEKGGKATASEILMYSNADFEVEVTAAWSGVFHFEIIASGSKVRNVGPEILIGLDGKAISKKMVSAEAGKDDTFDIPLRLKAGNHKVQIAFTNDESVDGKNGEKKEDRNLTLFQLRFYGAKPQPPLDLATVPEAHRRIVTVNPSSFLSNESALRKVISPLVVYCWRRPVSTPDTERLVKLAAQAMEDGESYEGSIQIVIQAMLLSPNFIFKVEMPRVGQDEEFPLLSEFELASRVSYFLTSTMPDKELFTLAWRKQLRDPVVLDQQIKRMLGEIKSAAFVENFAGQWLTLRKLENFEPNLKLFPKWDDEIRDLLRQETLLMVSDVFRQDQNVLELLDADYTFLNEKLARFYGVPGVSGDQFRKVSIKSQPRRGVLTHASVLAVTSNPTRTSPVKRGKFILDNILNKPPPPAPPGVPELEKGKLTGSLRDQIEQHRADPACAGCHKMMDPLGLALENYDAVGLWRTEERGEPVDATGTLPSGEEVRHAGDLIKVLRQNHGEEFVRCLTEKLMIFALGRGLEYYDKCAVDKIMVDASKQDFKFSALIRGVIESDAFQRKGYREE